MSVTDIIKALREAAEESQSVNDVMDWVAGELIALDAKRQEAEKKSRWISVKDRLPEDFEDVVVIISNGLNGYWYRVAYRERGSWSQGGGRRISDEVTHWMPLPEPPKEE